MKQSENTGDFPQDKTVDNDLNESAISEIIENSDLDEGDKKRIIRYIEKFSGPLPHPKVLKAYEEIQPGFANEILNMAKKEQDHRHEMDKMIVESQVSMDYGQLKIIDASIKMKKRLQLFGFFVTTMLFILGAICVFMDKNMGVIISFILALGSFCWTMFYGKSSKTDQDDSDDSENDNNNSEMEE